MTSPTQSPPSASLEEEILRLLARQGRRVPVPVFLAALLIAALAYGYVQAWILAAWLAWVAIVLAARWVVLGRLPALTGLTAQARLRVAVALSAINGAAHGLSLGFFPFIPELERAVQTMVLIGLCAGSVATTAGYLPIFLAYIVPTLGPLAALWGLGAGAARSGWIEKSTAGLIVLMGAILIALARDVYRLFRESFEIRLQQAESNRQLKIALDRAEAANRAKTRFLASASHDLRQPIHTLSLFGAALTMCSLSERASEVAHHMNTALQGLASQLDALLDISKLDAGVVRVERAPLELRPFLAHLYEEFEPVARDKGLELALECPRDAFVDTDRTLFERIARNLLDNSIKYTDAGRVSLRAQREQGGFAVTVADSGRGIPESEQDRVFEEFYQLDNPERDRTRGLGLGLAIVKRLADLLAIRMDMTSAPGEGTTFRLLLPGARSPSREQVAGTPETSRFASLHVLVIDDEAAVRLGMKTLLEGMGCRATLTDGTEQAVAAARDDKPDVVLADFRLRGADNGIDAVRALRQLYPSIPAVLISGDIAPERLREAEQAAIPLLHKPVPFDLLKQAIASAAER
jgi:signal transduction histidine kinase/CheY-like chemotaxis protein